MNEEMNNAVETEVVETYDAGTDVIEVNHSDAKAVAIGAIAATAVTAGIYGVYKLGGKVVAKIKTAKAKKAAEKEFAQAQAFEEYEDEVAAIHEEMDN